MDSNFSCNIQLEKLQHLWFTNIFFKNCCNIFQKLSARLQQLMLIWVYMKVEQRYTVASVIMDDGRKEDDNVGKYSKACSSDQDPEGESYNHFIFNFPSLQRMKFFLANLESERKGTK